MEDDKKYQILQGGIARLRGYGPTFSVDELCDEIGISKKTFYSYFESKNKFLQEILGTIVQGWQIYTENFLTPEKDIKSAFTGVLSYHIDELLLFNTNFLRNLRTKFPAEAQIIDNYYEWLTRILLKVLEQGQKENKVKKEYNLALFLEKERIFFEHLLFKENIFSSREDYFRLLSLSLEGILNE